MVILAALVSYLYFASLYDAPADTNVRIYSGVASSSDTGKKTELYKNPVKPIKTAPLVDPFKVCNQKSESFICAPVTQGYTSDTNKAPLVCGCGPASCKAGQAIIASDAGGIWPDSSRKGTFVCSDQFPS